MRLTTVRLIVRSADISEHDLDGRRILISGGTSGLGAATVRAAVAAGARVGVLGRRHNLLDALAAETGAEVAACDVADAQATDAAIAAIAARLGGLDGLVNCAGLMLHSRLTAGIREDWRQMLEVNVLGTTNACVSALPFLRAARYADLMIISSPSADRVAAPDFAMYSASKAALSRLAEALRAELDADGAPVRVTLVKPGYIDTDGVIASVRDPRVRALVVERAKTIGMAPATVANELVHLLALPADVGVHELSLARAGGVARAPAAS